MSSWKGGDPAGRPKRSWKRANPPQVQRSEKYWASGGRRGPLLSGKLVRFFLAVTILLGSSGFLVLQLWRRDLPTPVVSVSAIEYITPWQPNGWAVEDQERLFAWLNDSGEFSVSVKREKTHGTWKEILDLELNEVTPGGPGGSLLPQLFGYRALVIHLSAHGVLNGDGVPCLLFSDADPQDDTSWVPLNEVLSAIRDHVRLKDNPPKTLLILDTGKQLPDARCGVLASGFVDRARSLMQSLSYSDFAVLFACDDAQHAWSAPEIGGSVFGYMVANGLRGAADSWAGNNDRRLTVRELFQFVSACVDGYVREHRGRGQTPVLVWCGAEDVGQDFEIASVVEAKSLPTAAFQGNSNLQRMDDAWKSFSRWNRRTPSYISWPRAAALGRLARAEQLLWAGSGYSDAFSREIQLAASVQQPLPEPAWGQAVCGAPLALVGHDVSVGSPSELLSIRSQAGQAPVEAAIAGTVAQPRQSGSEQSGSEQSGSEQPDKVQPLGGNLAQEGGRPLTTTQTQADSLTDEARAQAIIAWLTFDGILAEGKQPPARPETGDRHADVALVYSWFSQNPRQLNVAHLDKVMEWLGRTSDASLVTREEALLRAIHDHLRLTQGWDFEAASQLGLVWGQFLQVAATCESLLAIDDPRVSLTLAELTEPLLLSQRGSRDQIHGCESLSDVNVCIRDLEMTKELALTFQKQRADLERGWRLCDQLAFELPVIADWIASPVFVTQAMDRSSAWNLSADLLAQFQQLNSTLVAGGIPSSQELELAENNLSRLTSAVSQSLYKIVDASGAGQKEALGNLSLVLGLRPSVLGQFQPEERSRLHRDLDGRYRDLQDLETVSQSELQRYCAGIESEDPHENKLWPIEDLPPKPTLQYAPLFVADRMLDSEDQFSAAASTDWIAWCQLGAHLRKIIKDQPEHAVRQARQELEVLSGGEPSERRTAQAQVLRVASQAQAFAQLVPPERLASKPNPTDLSLAVCHQEFALWHAMRGLDDFWKTPELPAANNPDFLFGSAFAWIQVAAQIEHAPSGPVAAAKQQAAQAAQLAAAWPSALQGLKTSSGPVTQLDSALELSGFATGWGWARLDLYQNSARPLSTTTRGRSRLQHRLGTGGNANATPELRITAESVPEGSHALIAWFRGHQARSPILVEAKEPPLTLAWNVEPPLETTIRVNADPQPARIAFVLDCSNSMGSNIEVAKAKLLEAIRTLPPERTEVCLFAFGHSTRYFTDREDSYEETWKKYRPQPTTRRPYNDVELLLPLTPLSNPLGQLDKNLMQRIQNDLKNLKNWGDTPLYESLMQANDLLKQDDGFRGIRKIIAITDGRNSVTANLPAGQAPRGKLVLDSRYNHSLRSIETRLAKNVVIDFIAFNFAGAPDELRDLAFATQGAIYTADNRNLGEQLNLSLFPDRFTTFELPTERVVGNHVSLAEKQDVPPQQLPGQFEVAIDGTGFRQQLALEGGEAIELRYVRQARLVFEAYDEGDEHRDKQSEVTNAAGQRFATIMLTGVPPNQPQVRLCLQSIDEKLQSRRPEEFVLELRNSQRGQATSRLAAWTSDAQWESRHRSPVLRVPLQNLKDLGSSFLEARLWLPGAAPISPAVQSIALARFQEDAVKLGAGITARATVRVESGDLFVTLTESRENSSESDSWLTHWQVAPSPDLHIEHRFHQQTVEHEFVYSQPTMLDQIRLTATVINTHDGSGWNPSQWMRVP